MKQADFVRSKSFLIAPAKPTMIRRQGTKPRLQEGLQRGISLSHQNLEKLIAYQREFLALKERLRIAEHRISQRSSELSAIVQQFRRVGAETNGRKNTLNKFSDNTIKLLKELTSKKSLQVPSIYYHLPHLFQNEGSLQPAVQIGNGRTGVSIVMGIPTVKREVKSYLMETLHSLIDNLYPEEKLDCVIVVFIGETDIDYVHGVIANLEKEWRTKQNLDYCFLMMYAQEKGTYYIQDKDYMKPLLLKIHVNPPAEVSTSLKVYQGHTLEKTYVGEDFFWALTPIAGDYILFKFDKPVNVESYLFHSGNQEHPGDILLNTTVEVLPFKSEGLELSKETKDKRLEDGYFRIGKFENGVAEGMVDPNLNPISAFRLSVIQNSAVWAILNEVRQYVSSVKQLRFYISYKIVISHLKLLWN
ncbi:Alpha-1,3-mannosyl-glycoprotein 4-beta-N-acetylglucosaminyltransferase A [Pteropus alecto]|uniref:Alpha-1,3-mannosyl-glycoprotein 4-beta-N-acetylglucosaminyltransferase A n=1 Tax=Pteropus alecto TaxID=9402 RepID=L5KUZ2_PTEAL|nr:Alpha-1,3-mannosyl-glycoprotein 4-beta-N-acetylglucosaminyltransferase A [Pteropus alecto]